MSVLQRGVSPLQATGNGTLLDAATGNTDGVWENIDRLMPWSVTIRGSFTATVNIFVSNQLSRPLNTDNDQAIFQSVTTPASLGSEVSYRWIKASITGWGGPPGTSVTVDFLGGR